MNYYNEHDPKAAAWLRELISAGLIPAGDVDTRSIVEVKPDEIANYIQCHFFAGIGGWSLALELAGWPPARPVWTGSCPCQPFSAAGKGKGASDDRHLWPVFASLIASCRPERVFGEQVAQAIGFGWLDGVSADLEAQGYTIGSAVLGAHSVGAPHIRQRLYWVADSGGPGLEGLARNGHNGDESGRIGEGAPRSVAKGGESLRLADADGGNASTERQQRSRKHGCGKESGNADGATRDGERPEDQRLANAQGERSSPGGIRTTQPEPWSRSRLGDSESRGRGERRDEAQPGGGRHAIGASWARFEVVHCRDGKARRFEPLAQCLVDGLPGELDALWNDCLQKIQTQILTYANATKTNPAQAVRAVRDSLRPEFLQWCLGGSDGLQAEAVLFAVLCELSRQLGDIIDGEASRGAEVLRAGMRAMRQDEQFASASSGREFSEQRPIQLADLVPIMSQEVASIASQVAPLILHPYPLAHGISGRVGLLRGYGNAIVPQVAAEFIIATREVIDGC